MADRAAVPPPSPEVLADYSRQMIQQGSKSFARAATLMPGEVRNSVYMLYAWCRHCDDVTDEQHLGFPAPRPSDKNAIEARVMMLRRKTRAAFRSGADELPFQALASVADKHGIPEGFALDLIDGFEMDAAGHRYASEEDTLRYCYHVAGAVGVMMAMVMGVRDRPTLVRACDLGLAFQLTNISRDVIADARAGRVYLPGTWLAEAGLDAGTLEDPANREALFTVVERLLDTADCYYASASHGLAHLPVRCAWSIASALRIYRAIGAEIRRAGPAAWNTRARTSDRQKLLHVTLAAGDAATAATWGRVRPATRREDLWTPPALQPQGDRDSPGVDDLVQISA